MSACHALIFPCHYQSIGAKRAKHAQHKSGSVEIPLPLLARTSIYNVSRREACAPSVAQ